MTNDDDLRSSYERLASAMEAPSTVPDGVPTRIRQRRRHRAWGTALAASVAIAGTATGVWALAGSPDETGEPAIGTATPSITESPLEVGPDGLACHTDQRVSGMFFNLGPRDEAQWPEDVARRFLTVAAAERFAIKELANGRWRATYFRGDGTALMFLAIHLSGDKIYPTGIVSCPVDDPATQTVELTIGHCWVEPFTFAGREWGLLHKDQFGGGGLAPLGTIGTGEVWIDGDVLRYRDYGGAELTFVPTTRPGVSLEGMGCL